MNNQLITDYYIIHRDELLAYVSSRLGGSSEAEDIVQDVFLRLLTSETTDTEINLKAFVYTITKNLINDYYRRRTTFDGYEHYIKRADRMTTSPESVYSVREITERLERGLARLPENCREVYRLHIYGGMKVSEISQQLCEDYKRVEHRLGAARKFIRFYLKLYA